MTIPVSLTNLEEHDRLLKGFIDGEFFSYFNLLAEKYNFYHVEKKMPSGETEYTETVKENEIVKATRVSTLSSDGKSLVEVITFKTEPEVKKHRRWVFDSVTGNYSAEYFTPPSLPSLNECSWAQIDEVSRSGQASQVFKIGDIKDVVINGETLTFEILDFNHDDLVSGGKAGITFGMKNLMKDTRAMNANNSNAGGAGESELHKYLNSTLFNAIPSDLKSVIKTVKKKTTMGSESPSLKEYQANLFLFSVPEVFPQSQIPVNYASKNDGYLYPRFSDDASRVKKLDNGVGSAADWWLGSPDVTYYGAFCDVYSSGGLDSNRAYNSCGVCFGFCI